MLLAFQNDNPLPYPVKHHHSSKKKKNAKDCDSCSTHTQKRDWLLSVTLIVIVAAYISHMFYPEFEESVPYLTAFTSSVFVLVNKIWWGILLGIFFVGILETIPRELVMSVLGRGGTFSGILRATGAGVLLDLCSHGILLVGTKLYERGASLGQVIAFLVASPWNSLTLTIILWSLVGWKWMLIILGLSLVVAIISGMIFDGLVYSGVLPKNPNKVDFPKDFAFWKELRKTLKKIRLTPQSVVGIVISGLKDSRMILRWIFFGIILAAAFRTFIHPEVFATLFGPTMAGLGVTIVFATILEMCSEGSLPVAADMLTRAKAGGNAFAFLMTGVSTDYTEIVVLKETTKSWKISFFLPLVTLPQIIIIAIILNQMTI